MLKKILPTAATLLFAFLVLGVSIFKASAQVDEDSVTPWEKVGENATEGGNFVVPPEETTASADLVLPDNKKADYVLPYPGILPDHPLYFLKMIRDRIWLILTTNPLKKAEVLLLFADKRIGAAAALVSGNKSSLGLTTAAKAEKYLERAMDQERVAGENGVVAHSFLKKLEKSCAKHEELIRLMEKEKFQDKKEVLQELVGYSQRCQEQIGQRLGK